MRHSLTAVCAALLVGFTAPCFAQSDAPSPSEDDAARALEKRRIGDAAMVDGRTEDALRKPR
jgi:hypothetical protein